MSAFYWARRQKLEPGESANMVLSCDLKDWDLQIDALGHEMVKWDGKKVNTLRVEPTTRVEGVEKRGKAWFNITTDSSHKPVRIIYKAPFGSVVGTLKQKKS